jgi:hypothetical protein
VWSKISSCTGCGIKLQSESPNSPGFIPSQTEGKSLCKRCYRLTHYGELAPTPLSQEVELKLAKNAISHSQLVLMLIDPIDFAGTLSPELIRLAQGKLAVVLTKMDLLPPIAKTQEVVAWCREELSRRGARAQAIFPISSKNGMGISRLSSFLRKRAPSRTAIVGVTNVGKSALLERLLPQAAPKPTISTLAGTTLDLNSRPYHGGQILDTPGLTPEGRMDAHLCPSCQTKLIPSSPISSMLYELDRGGALLFGSLGCLINHDQTVLQVYVPGSINIHRTNAEKAPALLAEAPRWLGGSCAKCPPKKWEEQEFTLEPLEDLAIAGLGWVSVRRMPTTVQAILPQGIRTQVRSAMLQKR